MTITPQQLKAIAPVSDKAAELFTPYLNKYMGEVNTVPRLASFLANVLHESGCLMYVHEIADGHLYEGRKDLGNTQAGDGKRYKGRGLFQLTGRANYTKLSKAWYGDDTLVKNPDLLATPENAVRSAYWFWNDHALNQLADTGDFKKIVQKINGGLNGLKQRQEFYDKAWKVLSA